MIIACMIEWFYIDIDYISYRQAESLFLSNLSLVK